MPTTRHSVIDLFAGVGGLSLGAARAGFDVRGAVEVDQRAVELHAKNFPRAVHLARDVGSLTGEELLRLCNVEEGRLAGLVGGPPCQGFSEIGRRVASDPRNSLFASFFRLVSETLPTFFVAENVPGLLAERNLHHLMEARRHLGNRYELLAPITVRASDYGAPTTRTRVLFIGYLLRKDLHALYDRGLLAINEEGVVALASALLPQYGQFNGVAVPTIRSGV